MTKKNREPRVVFETVVSEPTFHAKSDHIVAVLPLGPDKTIGIRFVSPEHLLTFFVELMEKTALTWPDHPLVQDYKDI